MNIDIEGLKEIERTKNKSNGFSDSLLLSSFISTIDNIIAIGNKMSKSEMAMFINSFQYWILNRSKKKSTKRCLPGTILEVELGFAYKPETPYRHSALVIKEYKDKVLIVPSTSNKTFVKSAYHPIDNPSGNKSYRKVGKSDGFDHDCVLALDDFKTISKNRIISTCGSIDVDSDDCLYKEIRRTLLYTIFNEETSEFEQRIENLNDEIAKKQEEIHKQKEKVSSLFGKIHQKNLYIQKLTKKK